MKVVVIGAGVIGLCTALELRRSGADVTVLDRETAGHGASIGNAGWVVPVLSAPLGGPRVLGEVARQTARGDRSVGFRPAAGLLRWGAEFVRNSTTPSQRHGFRATLELGARSVALFGALRESGVSFEMHRRGLLLVARTEHGLGEVRGLVAAARSAGYDGTVDTHEAAGLRRLEPAVSDRVVGGAHARSEAHVRPESLLTGLRAALAAEGCDVRGAAEVRGLSRSGSGWSVDTASGAQPADRVVIAAGVWSAAALAALGVRVPLVAGKGYSITADGTGTAPVHPMKLIEANIACTPFDGGLRVSGMFELGARGGRVRPGAIRRIRRGSARYLRDWRPAGGELSIAGLRPSTPDSLPLIGAVPGSAGVFVAAGHGTLGLTLAPATAAALVPQVLHDAAPGPELAPFAVGRFGRRPVAALPG